MERIRLIVALLLPVVLFFPGCGSDGPSDAGNDIVPPAVVTDFRATGVSDSTATFHWTAPGDDANEGTAFQYEIRYEFFSFTEADWGNLFQLAGEPIPSAAGSPESLVVTRLYPDETYYFAMKTRDEVEENWSGLSSLVEVKTDPTEIDTTPPARVTTLLITGATDTSLTMTWTAPGDDDTTGRADAYDLRYGTIPLDEGSWDEAFLPAGQPVPHPAGSIEYYVLAGLEASTAYSIALETIDDKGNRSPLSNVATGSTAAASAVPPR